MSSSILGDTDSRLGSYTTILVNSNASVNFSKISVIVPLPPVMEQLSVSTLAEADVFCHGRQALCWEGAGVQRFDSIFNQCIGDTV